VKVLITVIAAAGWLGSPIAVEAETAAAPTNVGAAVDQCVQAAMTPHDVVGLSAAVVLDGELVYEAGYGVKHRDHGGEVDAHTRFAHGSTGKQITAAAVMRLVDQVLVDLDRPVTEYVPELQFAPGRWAADQVRVRHLITNSAAVPSFRSASGASLTEWATTLADVPLLARPGAFFNYSNSNLALAGLVVERASGMSLINYLDTEVFPVAGMADSSADPAAALVSGNYAWGHADDGEIYGPEDFGFPNEVGSGNAFSSSHDLATWARLMMSGGGDLLGRNSCEEMQRRHVPRLNDISGLPPSIDGGHYGYGLFIDDYPDATVTWHSGGVPGYVGSVFWIRSEGFAVAVLANTWPSGFAAINEIFACIADAVAGVTMPDMGEPSDPATWGRYTGIYDSVFEDGFEFEVVVEKDAEALLMTAPNPQDPGVLITRELENTAGSHFLFVIDPGSWWPITFVADPGDPAPVRWIRNSRFCGTRRAPVRVPDGRLAP
jgi:CubicO group peptidase (beta-lactamase class C family)